MGFTVVNVLTEEILGEVSDKFVVQEGSRLLRKVVSALPGTLPFRYGGEDDIAQRILRVGKEESELYNAAANEWFAEKNLVLIPIV